MGRLWLNRASVRLQTPLLSAQRSAPAPVWLRLLVLYIARTSSYRLSQMRVTSLNALLFIEKLDWERVKKGGKFLRQPRLEDIQ
jgi:hypothetical protein